MSSSYRAARDQAKRRQRRIILNNDGNEPVYLIQEPTAEELLRYRTSPLVDSQVDTVFYTTWSSGFSLFTHLTKVGALFDTTEGSFATNKMADLAAAGVDPLTVMNQFFHANEREFFWSMRMNDTHDGQSADYAEWMFNANRFKQKNPTYLIGTPDARPRYGSWTAVDYAEPEVRDLAFGFVQEVCEGYDVDGIELDFYRHPVFFRGPARGFACTEIERDLMTDLVRRIRRMTEQVGERRGRPLLVAVRVPDSVPYCRAIGLDLERWLADDLLDLLIPAGYLKLNRWERTVELGHRHGVMVYPALDESRVREPGDSDIRTGTFNTPRGSDASYRARATNVWQSGADGVYLYNFFNPDSPILRQLGAAATLVEAPRSYFVSARGVAQVAGNGFPHEPYINVPTLNPQHPRQLFPGQPVVEELLVGDDPRQAGGTELAVLLQQRNGAAVRVQLNGAQVGPDRDADVADDGWLQYPVTSARQGINRLEVTLSDQASRPALLADARLDVS